MQPLERLQLYEASFRYAFFEEEPTNLSDKASIIFDTIKEGLLSDKSKYAERVERNRKNGSLGGRPKNPVGFSGLPIYNNNNNNNNNISISNNEEKEKETFCIYLNFFERGCENVEEEYVKFISYYDARGWVDRSGLAIKSRTALAVGWQINKISEQTAANRAFYAQLLKAAQTHALPLVCDFLGFFIDNTKHSILIRFKRQQTAIMFDEQVLPKVIKFLPTYENKSYTMSYQVLN